MRRWRALPFLGWCALLSCSEAAPTKEDQPTSSDETPETVEASVPDVRIPSLRELMGRISPAQDSAFAPIPSEICSREGMLLRLLLRRR